MNQPMNLSGARILMVDDTVKNLQVLGAILRQEGYRLAAARNGREALDAATAAPPDLILLDVTMPELDGYETCERLKADPTTRDVPVIFLTARVEQDDILRGFEVGGVDYVTKPFNAAELLVRVRTHLELKYAREKLLELAGKLGKYLSPQVYASIFRGERDAAITSYRRDLTVLFADIVGFTSRTEEMEHTALTAWLNRYLNEMARITLDHGGTLDKFIGDAVMVFFGDPTSAGPSQNALQCVQMAIAMQAKARELGVEIRVGISSGDCTVGNFGSEDRMEYTIVGATVNQAARLEKACPPGRIALCDLTRQRVETAIPCEWQGELQLKGIERLVPAWLVALPPRQQGLEPA